MTKELMILQKDTIRALTVGALEIKEDGNNLHFYKADKVQREAFLRRNSEIYRNALATTGIRIDFYTDSDYITVKTADGIKYEILIDGIIAHQFILDVSKRRFTADLPGDGKEHRITLVLPSHGDAGVINSIELADGAIVKPCQYRRKFLFRGDSITQGFNSDFDSGSYAYLVSSFFDAESVIQGVGCGCFWEDVFSDTKLSGFSPDTVFIAYGTNDFVTLNSLEDLKKNALSVFSKTAELYPDSKLIAITPMWRMDADEPRAMGTFDQCRTAIHDAASEAGFTVIDGYKLLPHKNEFMKDYVHPNDLGFAVIALNLINSINDIDNT